MPKGKDGAGGWCSLILVCLCIINNSKMLFAGTDTHHDFWGWVRVSPGWECSDSRSCRCSSLGLAPQSSGSAFCPLVARLAWDPLLPEPPLPSVLTAQTLDLASQFASPDA